MITIAYTTIIAILGLTSIPLSVIHSDQQDCVYQIRSSSLTETGFIALVTDGSGTSRFDISEIPGNCSLESFNDPSGGRNESR